MAPLQRAQKGVPRHGLAPCGRTVCPHHPLSAGRCAAGYRVQRFLTLRAMGTQWWDFTIADGGGGPIFRVQSADRAHCFEGPTPERAIARLRDAEGAPSRAGPPGADAFLLSHELVRGYIEGASRSSTQGGRACSPAASTTYPGSDLPRSGELHWDCPLSPTCQFNDTASVDGNQIGFANAQSAASGLAWVEWRDGTRWSRTNWMDLRQRRLCGEPWTLAVPESIHARLRAHQREALHKAWPQVAQGQGYVLHHDMGAGKTVTTLALVQALMVWRPKMRVLIVAPSPRILQDAWAEACAEWSWGEALPGHGPLRLQLLGQEQLVDYVAVREQRIREWYEDGGVAGPAVQSGPTRQGLQDNSILPHKARSTERPVI